MGAADSAVSRKDIALSERGQPMLALQVQRPGPLASAARALGDVVYVHGATFGADLSVFYRFDRRSLFSRLSMRSRILISMLAVCTASAASPMSS